MPGLKEFSRPFLNTDDRPAGPPSTPPVEKTPFEKITQRDLLGFERAMYIGGYDLYSAIENEKPELLPVIENIKGDLGDNEQHKNLAALDSLNNITSVLEQSLKKPLPEPGPELNPQNVIAKWVLEKHPQEIVAYGLKFLQNAPYITTGDQIELTEKLVNIGQILLEQKKRDTEETTK